MPGTLFIVATPIGNLEDITFHAINVLKKVDCILAEDTRVARKLLNHYQIKTPLKPYHHHSTISARLNILNMLLSGNNLALVSDAGTPGISDPGNELINYILSSSTEVNILPIPGPTAPISALSVSGFPTSKFLFLGFLPKKKLATTLNLIKSSEFTVVYFDSPHRVIKNLEKLLGVIEDREILVTRELTKLNETHYRGTAREVALRLKTEPRVRGEVTVVVSPTGIEPVSRV